MKNKLMFYSNFNKASSKRAISLITLVITIIVVIILAGAVILTLSQNNPIESANEAVFKSNIDNYKSELQLYITDQYTKNNFSSGDINMTGHEAKTNNVIPSLKAEDENKFAIENGELVYVGTGNDTESGWANDVLKTGEDESEPLQANPAVDEGNTGSPIEDNATINGEVSSYNNPIIPANFFAVNTEDARWDIVDGVPKDWNKGLVIQDEHGNQFVWVPVNETAVEYKQWYNDLQEDSTPSDFNINSIKDTYKGFYISRYEASFDHNDGSLRASSKISQDKTYDDWSSTRTESYDGYLWNYISYSDAKTFSENMDTSYNYDTNQIGTNLVTAAQWDTLMKWISNSGKDVSSDSSNWGNYRNSVSPADVLGYGDLQISGYSESWKANNIYDLAGNESEWINAKSGSNLIMVGGSFNVGGEAPPMDRFIINPVYSSPSPDAGFRVALYII